MKIDRESSTPSYLQLANHLKAAIGAGAFSEGNRLPAEADLVRQSQLSRLTVRRSLEVLEQEGWVIRRQGLGTFVRGTVNQDLSSAQSLAEVLLANGIKPRLKVLSFGAARPSENVRALLRLDAGAELLIVKRLFLHGEEPVGLAQIHLPLFMMKHAQGLRTPSIPTESTFTLWEGAGVRIKSATHTIRAGKADAQDALALGILIGEPILILERVTYDDDDRPFEATIFHYHWQRYKFSMAMPRVDRGTAKS